MWIFIVISGLVADLLRNRHFLSTTNVRKLMNATGQPADCLAACKARHGTTDKTVLSVSCRRRRTETDSRRRLKTVADRKFVI